MLVAMAVCRSVSGSYDTCCVGCTRMCTPSRIVLVSCWCTSYPPGNPSRDQARAQQGRCRRKCCLFDHFVGKLTRMSCSWMIAMAMLLLTFASRAEPCACGCKDTRDAAASDPAGLQVVTCDVCVRVCLHAHTGCRVLYLCLADAPATVRGIQAG